MMPWKLPLIVAALSVPIVAGFLLAGPALGVAVGALAVLALLVVAARQRPRGPLGATPGDARRHVLLVLAAAVEDPEAIRRVAAAVRSDGDAEAGEVRAIAPAQIGFLDRWASDVEGSRHRAQERLVATVAALAKAGIEAEARVGDEDLLQAVEDQLQSYPATDVVLVSEGEGGEAVARELRARLAPAFEHVRVPATGGGEVP